MENYNLKSLKKGTLDTPDVNVSGLRTFINENSLYKEGIYIHTDNSLTVDATTGELKKKNIATSSVPGTTDYTINYVNDKLVLSYKTQLNATEMGVIESGIASGDAAVTATVTGQIAMIWTAIGALAIACGINTLGAVGNAIATVVVDKNAKILAEAPLQQSGKNLGLNWNENELSLTDYGALQLDKRYARLIDWHPATGQEYGENVANVYLVGVAGTGIVDLIQKLEIKDASKYNNNIEPTFGHVFVECDDLAGAQSLMHDEIAGCLLTQIASKKEGSTLYQGRAMGTIWAECEQDGVASFVPDGILVVESKGNRKGKVILLEFARGMSERASDMEVKAQHKKNNYSNTLFFLRRFFSQHEVVHQTYIMGVLTTFKQSVWEAHLKEIGLTMSQSTAVQYECVKECVLA